MLYISITRPVSVSTGQPPAGWEMSLQMILYRAPWLAPGEAAAAAGAGALSPGEPGQRPTKADLVLG